MTAVSEYGGDAISELNEMYACRTIPVVNTVYFGGTPLKTSDEKRYFKNYEEMVENFKALEPELDIIHVRGIEPFRAFRPLTKKPIIYFGSPLEQDAFDTADAVEVFAPCWKAWLERDYHIPKERVFTIPQAIDLDMFRPGLDASGLRADLGGNPILGYVGSTQETYMRVDLENMVRRLLPSYPDLKLVILTQSVERNKFMKFSDEVEKHIIIRNVPHTDIPRYYNAFDVTLCLGSAPYAGNLKEIECQACGSPAVAFNVENRQYRFGYNYPYLSSINYLQGLRMDYEGYDKADLVKKIVALLRNPEERKRVGLRNRENVKRFSMENVGRMLEELYVYLLKGG